MNVNELTIGQLKELRALLGESTGGTAHSFEVGKAYLIRSVTMHYLGRLVAITDTDFVLEDASWLADSGRFSHCLQTGEVSEVEPFPDPAIVSRAGYIDATEWKHPLPREVSE